MYLNENEATQGIANVVKSYTDDYSIKAVKRKTVNLVRKDVFFILTIKSTLESEAIYNEYMKMFVQNDDLQIIESSLEVENKVLKDLFLIKCQVDVYGIGA